MDKLWLGPYRVRAFNSAQDSENRVHDDTVARRMGFAGGLVPGVDVYGYMAHLAVLRWGRDWLAQGTLTARFTAPVYDGEDALVSGTEADEGLQISVTCRGTASASGLAAMVTTSRPPSDAPRIATPPASTSRPPASEATLAPGTRLGMRPLQTTEDFAANYLRSLRETDPLYRSARLLHPGLLLRTCNWALTENVRLGPWIHTGSTVQNLAEAKVGATLTVAAVVAENREHKGHSLVELDAIVLADGQPVASVRHVAIWRPRQLRTAQAN